MKIEIYPVHAYLEQSRSFMYSTIDRGAGDVQDFEKLSGTFFFALLSQAYIYAFMAIQSFLSEQLWITWNASDKPLQNKFPQAKTFEHLMNSDLKKINDQINILSDILGIPQIHSSDGELWNDFLKVVKLTRDFLIHPSPEPEKVDKIVGHVYSKRDWSYPSEVASKILLHFMQHTKSQIPDWVSHNTLIRVTNIKAL